MFYIDFLMRYKLHEKGIACIDVRFIGSSADTEMNVFVELHFRIFINSKWMSLASVCMLVMCTAGADASPSASHILFHACVCAALPSTSLRLAQTFPDGELRLADDTENVSIVGISSVDSQHLILADWYNRAVKEVETRTVSVRRVYREREAGWDVINVRVLHSSAGEHIAVLEWRVSPQTGRVSIIRRDGDAHSQPAHFTFDIADRNAVR